MRMRPRTGFTLIELLVVIAIIGLLSTIVVISLNQARAKARDAKRMADLVQLRQALDLYAADNGGQYPPSPCGYNCNNYWCSTNWTGGVFEISLSPYMSRLPVDPINDAPGPWAADNNSYCYGNVFTNPPQYDLTTQLEDPNNPYRCGVKNYVYYSNQQPWCTAFGGSYTNQIFEASPI